MLHIYMEVSFYVMRVHAYRLFNVRWAPSEWEVFKTGSTHSVATVLIYPFYLLSSKSPGSLVGEA